MRRKLLLGASLFFVVTVVYLSLSHAPWRVHMVTIGTGLVVAIAAGTAAWGPLPSLAMRVLSLLGVTLAGAIALPLGLQQTVGALDELPLSIFFAYAALLGVSVTVFLAAVVLLDRFLSRSVTSSSDSTDTES